MSFAACCAIGKQKKSLNRRRNISCCLFRLASVCDFACEWRDLCDVLLLLLLDGWKSFHQADAFFSEYRRSVKFIKKVREIKWLNLCCSSRFYKKQRKIISVNIVESGSSALDRINQIKISLKCFNYLNNLKISSWTPEISLLFAFLRVSEPKWRRNECKDSARVHVLDRNLTW